MSPVLAQELDYSPLEDFEPVALLGEYTFVLFVGPAVPPKVATVDDYLRWVRQNPDYRDIGFVLNASHAHLLSMRHQPG